MKDNSPEMNSALNSDLSAKLDNQFTFHMAEGTQPLQYATIRGECLELARFIVVLCPESEERDQAIKRLNEVMFWANAAIARHSGTAP